MGFEQALCKKWQGVIPYTTSENMKYKKYKRCTILSKNKIPQTIDFL